MNTQVQATKGISWFGVVMVIPCVACIGFLAHMAFTLDNEALAALFTFVGGAMLAGGSQLR